MQQIHFFNMVCDDHIMAMPTCLLSKLSKLSLTELCLLYLSKLFISRQSNFGTKLPELDLIKYFTMDYLINF